MRVYDVAPADARETPPVQVTGSVPAAPVAAPAREEQYPRAGGVVEADRDIPQSSDDDSDDEEEGEDEGNDAPGQESATPAAESAAPASPDAPAAPGVPATGPVSEQGSEQREGGRRRRRRRRGGRGGERGGERGQPGQQGQDRGQGQPPRQGQQQQENKPGQERREAPSGRDRHECNGQERRDHSRRDQGRREDRRDHGRDRDRRDGGRSQERTNEHRGTRRPVKREVLANTSFEETRIAILEDGRLSELHWERKNSQNIVGNIYKGTVENVLPGISSAFVNIGFEKNAYLYISDVLGDKNAPIDQTLKKGQTVMVQVAKEAISTKGPKVTMDVSLPGRYLVFTPYQEYVGISKHIAEPEERQRLERVVDKLVKEHLNGKG
ncbi:MAG: ribonuclease E/G, partial [Elusimicrobia bacterium]|nr:ribonuclease E/G [Elusimicrobiota bacterium]